jgi:hypothetical protein
VQQNKESHVHHAISRGNSRLITIRATQHWS